jgi:hypothetical protein
MLLDGDGYSFIQYYYEYVDKIYNYQPLVKIASKVRLRLQCLTTERKQLRKKAGNPMPKQAHMELALRNELDIKLGDIIYYINTGVVKSHGDLKTTKNKGVSTVTLNCKLIEPNVVEKDLKNQRTRCA